MTASAGDFVVARRGSPAECVIALPAEASASQVYAAEELRTHVAKMTGVRLPVATNAAPGFVRAIRLGGSAAETKELGEDGFRLVVSNGLARVIGSSVRGTLYGVYELLERFGGCRWYASWHTVVPERGAFVLPDALDETQRPAFLCRDIHWWDMFKPDFATRNRANGASHRLQANHGGSTWRFGGGLGNCHTFQRLLSVKDYGRTHPEYFAWRDGKRQTDAKGKEDMHIQLCLTNPDVLRIVTSNVLDRIRRDPAAKFYGVSQNDNGNYCQCPACAAVDAEEGSPSGTVIRFVNAVAEDVERVYPDKVIETLAYRHTRHLPKKTRPRRNVMPCLCSIECEFSRSMEESLCVDNANFVRDIRDWGAASSFLYVWDYCTNFSAYPNPFANVYAMYGNVKFFRDRGVKSLFEQGGCQGRHAGFAELKAWLLGKLMWNPDQPLEPLLADFFAGYYGKGAPYVRRVFDELHRRTLAYNATPDRVLKIYQRPWSDDCVGQVPTDFLVEARSLLQQAEAAVAGEPSVYSYNVRMTGFGIDYVLLERLRFGWGGKLVDFTRREDASERVHREQLVRELAASLLTRMDEARDIRLCEGAFGQEQVLEAWRTIVSDGGQRQSASLGVVEDSYLLKQGVDRGWTQTIRDPRAQDGTAIQVFHRGWVVVFQLDRVSFRPGRRYAISARLRADVVPGREGPLFHAGVYDPDAKKSKLDWRIGTEKVSEPGEYAWYDIGSWVPDNPRQYFWLGNGPETKPGEAATTTAYVDAIRFTEVP